MFHTFQNTCPDLKKTKATHGLTFYTFYVKTFFKILKVFKNGPLKEGF